MSAKLEQPDFIDNFFIIDQDRLIEQWSTFARDYYRRACQLADAKAEHERMKRVRDIVAAELDKDIRLHPEDYGLESTTEKAIEKTILLQQRYRHADEEVIKSKHSMDIHQAFVDAMDAMRKGLESYTYLWQSTYFAEPKVRGEARGAIADAKIDKALGPRRNRYDD